MNLEQKVENLVQSLPWRRRNQEILIDVVDACPGSCPSCPVAVDPRRDGHRMSLDTFKRILDKAQSEVNVWKVQLYRWSDPLLHPDIHLFIEELYRRGIPSSTSSFLQTTNCDWDKLAASKVTEFRVSCSGHQMNKYQKPATLDRFIKKFVMLSALPWASETAKVFFYHLYKDNQGSIGFFRDLAERHGFKFVTFPATFMVYDRIVTKSYTAEDKETISWLTETPEQNIARHRRKPDSKDWCGMQEREIVLDSYGRMNQCQMLFKAENRIGDFLETPYKELRKRAMDNPFCLKCKAAGVPRYSLIFSDPAKDPDTVAVANKGKYKTLPDFGGFIEGFE
jgi:hypothetical protein